MKIEKQISMRLETDVYEYISKLAKENRTTFSHEIRRLIYSTIKDKLKK